MALGIGQIGATNADQTELSAVHLAFKKLQRHPPDLLRKLGGRVQPAGACE
jgi:hypothetical protein